MAHPSLARSPLLVGLDESELDAFEALGRPRRFETGEELCRAGDPTDTIMLITSGLVHWFAPTIQGAGQLLLRLRKGDPIGAQDAIAGELRSATAVASIVTSALELDADEFREFAQRHPQILVNIVRNQRERMFRVNERSVENERGEEIALVAGDSVRATIGRVVAAARLASPRPVTYLDRQLSFAGSITAADDLTAKHGTVFIPSELDPQLLAMMLDEVDRVVALVGTAEEARKLGELSASQRGHRIEVVLIGDEAAAASRTWGPDSGVTIVRTCEWHEEFPLGDVDLLWLARHLTRTKLGIALGAGGAKGFAHVGMLQVLEENGYTIDFAGGSSIGGFVAAHVALGYDAQETYSRFRAAFEPDTVAALFAPMRGATTGLAALTQMLQDATELRGFSDAVIPLVIMAVDLTDRVAAPLRDGPLWEALLAALAVAGVYPPREREGHRLVDGLALVPVPTASVVDDGADLVVSVNLMGAETLERWPEGLEAAEPPQRRGKPGLLDTMLEVMDLSQLDTSRRHAALADVVVTPRFARTDWRDFHLADLFLAAGRLAALEQLPVLQSLSQPVNPDDARREEHLSTLI